MAEIVQSTLYFNVDLKLFSLFSFSVDFSWDGRVEVPLYGVSSGCGWLC